MAEREAGDEAGGTGSSGHNMVLTNRYVAARPGSRPGQGLYRLALASVIATFGLIVLGGIVRVTGSGLGCGGEWPLCDGSLIPPLTKEDIIEYSHRLVASAIVGPLVLGTFLLAFFKYRRARSVVIPAAVSVVLLLAQGGLGGVTVLTELPGHIVAAHMALAQALFACLILIAVAALRFSSPASEPEAAPRTDANPDGSALERGTGDTLIAGRNRFPVLAGAAALFTYLLLLSGSYVTATPGALAACPQWPLCDGTFWPSDSLETIHMLHRVVAAAVGILLLYTLYRGFRVGKDAFFSGGMTLMILSAAGAILFLTQVFIGAVAVWSHFPVELRAYHIGLATAVWGIMVAVALLSKPMAEPDQLVLREAFAGPTPGTEQAGRESA